MSREVEWDENTACDFCGKSGAFFFMGDIICADCLLKSEECLQRRHYKLIQKTVLQQAEDEGLWFIPTTASEAYVQQELRRLHAVIERRRI